MQILQALVWAEKQMFDANLYFGHGTDNAWDESCLLLSYVLRDQSPDACDAESSLSPVHWQGFQELVHQRVSTRKPAAYLTGTAWFAGLPFAVNEDVLVPRSPIAELIEQQFSPWFAAPPRTILDMCTGSGCIGIASAIYCPHSQVVLSDISAEALTVAARNVERHAMQDRCRIAAGSLFKAVAGQTFDLIVTNPPYVDANDIRQMPDEFAAEPLLGLAAGDDGLDLVREILAYAAQHLNPGGCLICEVGNSAEHLQLAYPTVPFLWLEFERGGDGVFLLEREQLVAFQDSLSAAYNADLCAGTS